MARRASPARFQPLADASRLCARRPGAALPVCRPPWAAQRDTPPLLLGRLTRLPPRRARLPRRLRTPPRCCHVPMRGRRPVALRCAAWCAPPAQRFRDAHFIGPRPGSLEPARNARLRFRCDIPPSRRLPRPNARASQAPALAAASATAIPGTPCRAAPRRPRLVHLAHARADPASQHAAQARCVRPQLPLPQRWLASLPGPSPAPHPPPPGTRYATHGLISPHPLTHPTCCALAARLRLRRPRRRAAVSRQPPWLPPPPL